MELSFFSKQAITPPRFYPSLLITFLVILFSSQNLFSQILPGIPPVNNPSGGFHIEGDLQANTPTVGKGDWLPGPSGAGGNVLSSTGAPLENSTTFHLTDAHTVSENNFSGGKKYYDNPNTWTWTTNSATAKCDINNALFHFTTTGSGDNTHIWLIMAADRRSNSGSAYIDFELYQKPMTDNPNGTFTSAGGQGGRTIGDMLLTLALTNGGGTAEFFVSRWETSGSGYNYIDKTNVVPAGSVFASTNAAAVPVPFSAFGSNQYSSNLFVEAAVDLTALLGVIDPCTSLGVKTLFIKTKTSPSPTATLVDFISAQQVDLQLGGADAGPDQSLCSNTFSISGKATTIDNITSHSWSIVPGGGTATITNPADYNTSVTITSGTSVKVALAATTFKGCVLKDTVMLTLKAAPTVSVNSPSICPGEQATLTASNNAQNPTFSWSPGGATTSFINVTPANTTQYTVTVTDGVSGCSTQASGTVTIKPVPETPLVNVVNNCNGTSTLTVTNKTGTLAWSTGQGDVNPITVTVAGTYTVTQTSNGCTSGSGSGIAAPKTTPATPIVSVTNNCDGTSTLTVTNKAGTLAWSTGQGDVNPVTVSVAGTYTVTQTSNGCTSGSGSGIAAPKTTPATPIVSVTNNCDGTSTLTVTNKTGTLAWSTGQGDVNPITVSVAGTYTVTQTSNGCTSGSGSGIAAPKTTPATPIVSVTNNCDGTSTLTVTNKTGILAWSTGQGDVNPITVTVAGTYTVTQTNNGCTSGSGSGIAAPKTTPATPIVSVTNNCNGTSTLTVTNKTGTLAWSTGQGDVNPITVTVAGTYTVTQTSNGCTSGSGSGIAAPKTTPATPIVSVTNNCDGTSTLTVTNKTGTLAWSTGQGDVNPITVTVAGTYTVTQTSNGCTSGSGSGIAAPRATPATPTVTYNAPACDDPNFSVSIGNVTAGAIYAIRDKNGNTIPGVLPGSSYTSPDGSDFSFTEIPAGSGYQVTVSLTNCPAAGASCGGTNRISQSSQLKASVLPATSVTAYPNPFTDRVRFRVESSAGGHASLDIYNVMGQKVKTPFQGIMQKGEVRTIDVYLPNAAQSNLMYIFRIGNEKVSGKLLKL